KNYLGGIVNYFVHPYELFPDGLNPNTHPNRLSDTQLMSMSRLLLIPTNYSSLVFMNSNQGSAFNHEWSGWACLENGRFVGQTLIMFFIAWKIPMIFSELTHYINNQPFIGDDTNIVTSETYVQEDVN